MKAIQKEVEVGFWFLHMLLVWGWGLLLFQVHIYQAGLKELDYEAIEKFKYENYSLHDEETDVMPLKWYEAQPVVSKKIVVMHLQ